MNSIGRVAIVGGTHGNEYSGIYLLKKWENSPDLIKRSTFKVETLLANANAFSENKRYVDMDLNRQFRPELLDDPLLANYEQSRAKVINLQLGPKGSSKTDFIIDLHNTTSNMGPTLILMRSDPFNTQLAGYVQSRMESAVILFEDHCDMKEQPFLCSISEQGVIIEVGPQPQSVLRQDILESMEEMTMHVLDFVNLYNLIQIPPLPSSIYAFRYVETLKLPEDEGGERRGMVHKNIQDNDFKCLKKGDPIFCLFDGNIINWEGDYEAYPHFINEAAYYDNNLAMSLAKKVEINVLLK